MEDESKLPKWAQNRLGILRGRVKTLEGLMHLIPKSDIYIKGCDQPRFYLPKDSIVTFQLGVDGDINYPTTIEVSLVKTAYRVGLQVRTTPVPLAILPEASNSVFITEAKR